LETLWVRGRAGPEEVMLFLGIGTHSVCAFIPMPWNNITPKCDLLFPQQNQLESGILEHLADLIRGLGHMKKMMFPPGSCKTY
jgi:hypothetical protein